MITIIRLDLTDDQRRAISGKRTPATREQVTDFVERLVAGALRTDRTLPVATVARDSGIDYVRREDCTTLDHLYPLGPKTAGTPCYCGQRRWGGSRTTPSTTT